MTNTHKLNMKKNKYIQHFLMFVIFIVLIIIIIICIIILMNCKNELNNYNNDISSKLDDAYEKQNVITNNLEEVDSAQSSLVKEFYLINNLNDTVSNISNNYLSKEDFEYIKNIISNLNNYDLYNYSEIINDMNNINNSINNNDEMIESLYLDKEDISNKTGELSAETINNNYYITCSGLETELIELFDVFYPIGSIYTTVGNQLPLHGTWQKLETNRVLWSDENGNGSLLSPTLPNVKGDAGAYGRDFNISGLFNRTYIATNIGKKNNGWWSDRHFSLANANSIYKDGATVRPPAIEVQMYKRIS